MCEVVDVLWPVPVDLLGVTRIEVVRAEGVMLGPEHAQVAAAGAPEQAAQLKAA